MGLAVGHLLHGDAPDEPGFARKRFVDLIKRAPSLAIAIRTSAPFAGVDAAVQRGHHVADDIGLHSAFLLKRRPSRVAYFGASSPNQYEAVTPPSMRKSLPVMNAPH